MRMTKIMTATTELLIRFLKMEGKNIMTVKWSVGNAWFSKLLQIGWNLASEDLL